MTALLDEALQTETDRRTFDELLEDCVARRVSLYDLALVLFDAATATRHARAITEIQETWRDRDERRERVIRDLLPLVDELLRLVAPFGRLRAWAEELKATLPIWADLDALEKWANAAEAVFVAAQGLRTDLQTRPDVHLTFATAPLARNPRGQYRRTRRGRPPTPWLHEARKRLTALGIPEEAIQDDLLRLVGALPTR